MREEIIGLIKSMPETAVSNNEVNENLGLQEADDSTYYSEIVVFLQHELETDGEKRLDEWAQKKSSDPIKWLRMMRQRARNYSLLGGQLYHGCSRNRSRHQVVVGAREQRAILQRAHIHHDTGVHVGVSKMYAALCTSYFWLGLYRDVKNFVRNCGNCVEAPTGGLLLPAHNGSPPASKAGATSEGDGTCSADGARQTSKCRSREAQRLVADSVWARVEMNILSAPVEGQGEQSMIALADPVSRWISAQALPVDSAAPCHISEAAASFAFSTFCTLGFPCACSVVSESGIAREAMWQKIRSLMEPMKLDWLPKKMKAALLRKGEHKRIGTGGMQQSAVPSPVDGISKDFESSQVLPSLDITLNSTPYSLSLCKWAWASLRAYMERNVATWPIGLDAFLFEERRRGGRMAAASPLVTSPFALMFGRDPTCGRGASGSDVRSKRRKLRSSILECRHCEENFTSKISFQIHQKKHTEEALWRGLREDESEKMSDGNASEAAATPLPEPQSNAGDEASPRRVHSADGGGATRKVHHCSRIRSCSWKKAHLKIGGMKKQCQRGIGRLLALAQVGIVANAAGDKIPRDSQRASFTAQTVASVRASLEAKRMKHIRRGNYQRYSPELREEIAKHAISHGISQTTKHFSSTPGAKPISESTVRNFVRAYCSPASHLASCLRNKDLGEEIGKFAACAGTEAAVRYYSSRLGMEVKRGTVSRLRHAYLKKHSPPEEGQGVALHKRKGMEMSRRKRRYGALLRDEIGNYAAQHGVRAAVQHYSERLLFPVRDRTITKFLKMYVEKESNKSPESPCELDRNASLLDKSFPPTTHPHQEDESIPPTNPLSSPANVLDDEGSASLVVYGSYATGLSSQQQGVGYHHDSGLSTFEIHSTGPTIILDQAVANTGFCHSHDLGYDQSVQAFSTNFNPEVNPGVSSASVESLGMDHNAPRSAVAMSHEAMGTAEHVPMTHMPSTYVGAMMGIPHHHHLMGEAQGNGMLNTQVIVGEHTSSAQSGNNAATTLVSSNNLISMLPASSFVQHAKSQVLIPSSSSLIGQGDGDGSMLANSDMTSLQKTMDGDIMPPYYPLTLTTTPAYQMGNSDMSASIEIAKETTGEICTGSQALILGESLMSDPPLESQNSKSNQKEMLCVSRGAVGKPSCFIEATQCRDAERQGAVVGGESVEVGTMDFLGTVHLEEEENLPQSTTDTQKKGSEKKPLPSKAAKKKTKCPQKSKRGNYIFLSPELRARIGRYAAEHGNLKTAKHFEAEVGRPIPESTIRGLRDKFVMKQMHVSSAQSSEGSSGQQVTALGYAPRGRPMVLGKYDEVVQDCMHELVKSGEKVGSSLAIATARQVLTQYEPSLLEEFGGPIKLNNSWAKSFIKRIGLSRNS